MRFLRDFAVPTNVSRMDVLYGFSAIKPDFVMHVEDSDGFGD
jgi:hypothetical protein